MSTPVETEVSQLLIEWGRGDQEALDRLATIDPQQSRVVELRVFSGLSVEETAAALDILPRTVKREWSITKAWLHQQLKV